MDDFYYTDEIVKHAGRMIEESGTDDEPLFSYVTFTDPHWPLHAPEQAAEKYRGVYDAGWDDL